MSDILSSVSILVAILTTLYGLFIPEIKSILDITPETGSLIANNQQNHQMAVQIRNSRVLPLLIGSNLLTAVFLPECWLQLNNAISHFVANGNHIDFKAYNTVSAAYILTTLFAVCLTAAVWYTALQFFKQVRALRFR